MERNFISTQRYYQRVVECSTCICTHKFHFSSDSRERNDVVFQIINSGVCWLLRVKKTENADFCQICNINALNRNCMY